MKWEIYTDENNNTFWECPVCIKGVLLYYRIVQKLKNNTIIYVEKSSDELLLDRTYRVREEWKTSYDAKYDLYRHYITITTQDNNHDSTGSV
jgi:hypothetical protein